MSSPDSILFGITCTSATDVMKLTPVPGIAWSCPLNAIHTPHRPSQMFQVARFKTVL